MSSATPRVGLFVLGVLILPLSVRALDGQAAKDAEPEPERISVHGQSTFIGQYHPGFHARYTGPLSLSPNSDAEETLSASLFVGLALWQGAEFYVNPELLQGFGLSNSTGVAAFTNGEAFKVGTQGAVRKSAASFSAKPSRSAA